MRVDGIGQLSTDTYVPDTTHASGTCGESSVIWVRDSDSIRDRVKVWSGSRLWFWLQLGLGLETLLDIDAPDVGGCTDTFYLYPSATEDAALSTAGRYY